MDANTGGKCEPLITSKPQLGNKKLQGLICYFFILEITAYLVSNYYLLRFCRAPYSIHIFITLVS
jgi:hypothetical protein